jgi:hypothetical protein
MKNGSRYLIIVITKYSSQEIIRVRSPTLFLSAIKNSLDFLSRTPSLGPQFMHVTVLFVVVYHAFLQGNSSGYGAGKIANIFVQIQTSSGVLQSHF